MEIKNEALKKLINCIEEENITVKDVDDFTSNLDYDGLKELFSLIEEEKLDLFILKIYITGYNEELIKQLEEEMSKPYVDAMFATMWAKEITGENNLASSSEIVQAMLSFVLLGSDLPSRVRNGAKLLKDNACKETGDCGMLKKKEIESLNTEFEEQMKYLVLFLNNEIEKSNFFNAVTQQQDKLDDSILENEAYKEDLDSIIKLRDRVIIGNKLIELYDEGDFNELKKEKINKSKYKFLKADILNLVEDLEEENTENTENIKQEDKKEAEEISSLVVEEDSCLIAQDELTPLVEEDEESDYQHLEVVKDQKKNSFLDSFKSLFKKDNQSVQKRKITVKKISRNSRGKKNNSIMMTMVLVGVLIACGAGFVVVTQKEKVNNDLKTPEKIAESTLTDKKFDIIREGTNKISVENEKTAK